jgi:hypothetical protein
MSLATESKVLGINDGKMFELLTDTSASLTYDAGIDVPGITSLKTTPNFTSKELKGDESILDEYAKLDSIDWSFENSILSLTALSILLGGNVAASGVTPNMKQTYTLKSSDVPEYFKLEAKADYTAVGDVHIVLFKCKANKVEYTLTGEDYAKVTASGTAIGTVNDTKVKEIVFNETATDIVTGAADNTPPTVSTAPVDAATAVAAAVNLVWTFSEAIDPSCVTPANFMLMKATDGTIVPGTLSIDGANTTVTLDPTSSLTTATAYIGIATTNVADLHGNHMEANSIVNFTVA